MANTLRFKRGLTAGLPASVAGEPLFTTDTFDLYIGNGTTNTRFQKYIASGTTSQLLRGDGSLLTMPIVLTSPSNGQVLKYNGTSWVNDSDSGITGTGAAGQVAYWSGTNTQVGSANLVWDAANNRLGINATPGTGNSLHVNGNIFSNTISTNGGINLNRNGDESYLAFQRDSTPTAQLRALSGGGLRITAATAGTEWARFHSTGNFSIGSTTDTGQRLQVTGDTLLKGSGNTSATIGLTVQNSDGTNMLRVRNDGIIFLGGAASNQPLLYTGNAGSPNLLSRLVVFGLNSYSTLANGESSFTILTNQNTTTTATSNVFTINSIFSPTSGTHNQTFSNIIPTINQTGGANGITRGLYVNPTLTAAADWRSIEWSNSTGWGLYGAGTANNYLAGRLLLGYAVDQSVGGVQRVLQISGTTSATSFISIIRNSDDNAGGGIIFAKTRSATNGGATIAQDNDRLGTLAFCMADGTNTSSVAASIAADVDGTPSSGTTSGRLIFSTTSSSATVTERLRITSTGNSIFGYTGTNSGETVQINGTLKTSSTILGGDLIEARGTTLGAFYLRDSLTAATNSNLMLFGRGNATLPSAGVSYIGNIVAGNTNADSLHLGFLVSSVASARFEAMRLFSSGNVLIQTAGTYNDNGFKLDVQGTFRATGAATFSSSVTIATNLVLNGTSIEQNNASGLTLNASNASGAILFRTAGAERLSISNTGAANFSSSIQAATAIAIGTTPDTNKPFKILKNINATVGINFENTSTSSLAFSAIQMGTDVTGGTAFTNLVYGSSGITEAGAYKPSGTSLVNTGAGGLNFLAVSQPIRFFTSSGNGTLRASITNDGDFTQFNGTNPSASTTDAFRMYSADVVAGNAAPHFRTENGAVIKLYQETTAVGNSTISVGGGSAVLDDTEFGGYTLRQVVQALRNQGILA